MNENPNLIKIKSTSQNISIRKNKKNENHILNTPVHSKYNNKILKSPFKSKSPFNLTKRKIDRKYFHKEKIPFYDNSKTISNKEQNTIENHYSSFIKEISINTEVNKDNNNNQMILKRPFEKVRKKKTISELLFDKKPNILIKKRNLSSAHLKTTKDNNKNIKNDYNNNIINIKKNNSEKKFVNNNNINNKEIISSTESSSSHNKDYSSTISKLSYPPSSIPIKQEKEDRKNIDNQTNNLFNNDFFGYDIDDDDEFMQ